MLRKQMTAGRKPESLSLGPLETALMNLLWQMGSATVRDVLESGRVAGAYTTVMTTLDRLHKKGVLSRVPEGRAFRYAPVQTKSEFNGALVRNEIKRLFRASDASAAPISYLVDAISEYDHRLLDQLQREIEKKRRELDGGEAQ